MTTLNIIDKEVLDLPHYFNFEIDDSKLSRIWFSTIYSAIPACGRQAKSEI
jgi:hypothetical protein